MVFFCLFAQMLNNHLIYVSIWKRFLINFCESSFWIYEIHFYRREFPKMDDFNGVGGNEEKSQLVDWKMCRMENENIFPAVR